MGVAAADYDGDGIIDIFTTNFSEDTCTLYRGLGGGLFDDVSVPAGIAAATFLPLSWGTAMADFDNDGDLDIVIANGHIYPQIDSHPEIVGTFAQRNLLLENDGGLFHDVTGSAGPGFQLAQSSRGLAVGDYDNDGDLDILITNLNEAPNLLLNESAGGSWLTVAPVVEPGRGPLIGTKVTVTAGGRMFVGDVAAGDSYVSTHDPRVHFGLGKLESVDTVDVRWPDGSHTTRHAVRARQFLAIRKGS